MKTYSDYVYDIMKTKIEGMDAIYEHYIIRMVGEFGLDALVENQLLENCGMVNGNRLFVLLDKKE